MLKYITITFISILLLSQCICQYIILLERAANYITIITVYMPIYYIAGKGCQSLSHY